MSHLLREAVDAPSLEVLKASLSRTLSTMVQCKIFLPTAELLNLMPSQNTKKKGKGKSRKSKDMRSLEVNHS